MLRGQEFHSIIQNIFENVKGVNVSEQLQVCCPLCQKNAGLSQPDGKYNLEINTAKRKFKCWKCSPKFSGSLGKLVKYFGTENDKTLYKVYSDLYGEYTEEDVEHEKVLLPDEMILFSDMDVNNPQHMEAYLYMVAYRKMPKERLLYYRIGFCIEGKYKRRIIIPSYNKDGIVDYFVGRTYDPKTRITYENPKSDKNNVIFNEGFINWDSTIYLCEGTFEMLSFPINVIPLLGKTISEKLFLKLREIKPNIIVVLDPDAIKDNIKLFQLLNTIYIDCEEKIRIITLPNNEDLDELIRNHESNEVIKHLYSARVLNVDDYFKIKLSGYGQNNGGFGFSSGNTEWKSESRRNAIF